MGYVKDKVVMVTGGGECVEVNFAGSWQPHEPKQLIIVDIYENNAYDIQQELIKKFPELNLVVLIASVRNTARINYIFKSTGLRLYIMRLLINTFILWRTVP